MPLRKSSVSQIDYVGRANTRKNTSLGGAEDFIQTPRIAVKLLLEVEDFKGTVWEPMCGRGSISIALIEAGFKVRSSDLMNHGFGETGIDAFGVNDKVDNVITNPPYSRMVESVTHLYSLVKFKMALLLPLQALGSSMIRARTFAETQPAKIYAFTKKIPYVNRDDEYKPSAFPHCWVV